MQILIRPAADLVAELDDGATAGAWREDYVNEMKSAVEALRPLCDPSSADAGTGAGTGGAALP